MKTIIITSKRIKTELYFGLGAIIIALILNVYSIIKYETQWTELITQMGYVLALSALIYLLIALVRFFFHLAKRSFKKRTTKDS